MNPVILVKVARQESYTTRDGQKGVEIYTSSEDGHAVVVVSEEIAKQFPIGSSVALTLELVDATN